MSHSFWPLEGAITSCKHSTDMLPTYSVAYLHIQQIWSNTSINFESCFWLSGEFNISISSLLVSTISLICLSAV